MIAYNGNSRGQHKIDRGQGRSERGLARDLGRGRGRGKGRGNGRNRGNCADNCVNGRHDDSQNHHDSDDDDVSRNIRKLVAKKHRTSLLERLLATEVQKERNTLLQSIRHIIRKRFFDGIPVEASSPMSLPASSSDDLTSSSSRDTDNSDNTGSSSSGTDDEDD